MKDAMVNLVQFAFLPSSLDFRGVRDLLHEPRWRLIISDGDGWKRERQVGSLRAIIISAQPIPTLSRRPFGWISYHIHLFTR